MRYLFRKSKDQELRPQRYAFHGPTIDLVQNDGVFGRIGFSKNGRMEGFFIKVPENPFAIIPIVLQLSTFRYNNLHHLLLNRIKKRA